MSIEEPDDIVDGLRSGLLPSGTPVLPDLDLAAHFSVAAEAGEAGGAWFDVVVLDSGRVALVAGQVPGRGPGAVVAAAGVAAVVRASLLCDEHPGTALELADLYAASSADARSTTVTVAVVDRRRSGVSHVSAGHEPPVVVRQGGPARSLESAGAAALGSGGRYAVRTEPLEAGDLLLVGGADELSARGPAPSSLADLLDRARVVGDVVGTCAALSDLVAGRQPRGACVLVLAEARASTSPDLEVRLPVDAGTPSRARREVQSWLDAVGVPAMDSLSLVHASAELVSNAVDHAYRGAGSGHAVVLRASHTGAGDIVVDVVDEGRWLAPSDDITRGRGLAMAAGLVDDLTVESDDGGTRARLRHRLVRPVLTRRPDDGVAGLPVRPLRIVHEERGVVRLGGAIGHDDADEVTSALMVASRGGTQPVRVDLTEVTHLSGGGVRVLGDAVRAVPSTSDPAAVVTLLARSGTVPQRELARAGVPHRPT